MSSRPRAAKKKSGSKSNGMIEFSYGDVSYQIDPGRRKVYRRWIEVETAKTFVIMSAWNQTQAPGKKMAV
jgi:hypothetical protein